MNPWPKHPHHSILAIPRGRGDKLPVVPLHNHACQKLNVGDIAPAPEQAPPLRRVSVGDLQKGRIVVLPMALNLDGNRDRMRGSASVVGVMSTRHGFAVARVGCRRCPGSTRREMDQPSRAKSTRIEYNRTEAL